MCFIPDARHCYLMIISASQAIRASLFSTFLIVIFIKITIIVRSVQVSNRCLQRPDLDNNQSCCHPMDFHTRAHPTSLLSSILSILPFIIIIIKIIIISPTCCNHQYCSKVVTSTFFLGSTQCWSKKKGKWVAYFEKSLPVTS